MCDHESFQKMNDDITQIKISQARVEEQIKTLFSRVSLQFWAMFTALILLLLTVIYSAVGPNGYQAVTSSAHEVFQKIPVSNSIGGK